ncbi:uncharacterized protein [Paramormyrops kingsleyae]|uniref:uncharacterized protein n=1 Tax=Paramormyrops kingsleyae TaxID=1676925 RepID=UPI000CD61B13|nr:uncharacterized protein LOC111858614 [Paramormyrops kingsleyae]
MEAGAGLKRRGTRSPDCSRRLPSETEALFWHSLHLLLPLGPSAGYGRWCHDRDSDKKLLPLFESRGDCRPASGVTEHFWQYPAAVERDKIRPVMNSKDKETVNRAQRRRGARRSVEEPGGGDTTSSMATVCVPPQAESSGAGWRTSLGRSISGSCSALVEPKPRWGRPRPKDPPCGCSNGSICDPTHARPRSQSPGTFQNTGERIPRRHGPPTWGAPEGRVLKFN